MNETHQSPFSDLMLQWLAEGDLQDEATRKQGVQRNGRTAMRDAPAPRLTRWLGVSPESRRQRLLLAGAAVVSIGLIFMVRRYSAHADASADKVSALPGPPDDRPRAEAPVPGPERLDRVVLASSSVPTAPGVSGAPAVPAVPTLPAVPAMPAVPAPSAVPEVPAPRPQLAAAVAVPVSVPVPAPNAAVAQIEPQAAPSDSPELLQQDPPPAALNKPGAIGQLAAPLPDVAAAAQIEPEAHPSDSPELPQQDALRDCQTAIARENAHEALKTCGAAAEGAPDSPTAVVFLARANLLVGKPAESLRLARHALTMDAALPDAYLLIGSVQQSAGHAQNARSAYETYLRLSPAGRYATEVRAVLGTL